MKSKNYKLIIFTALLTLVGCRNNTSLSQMEIVSPVTVTDITYGSIRKTYSTTSTAISHSEAELAAQMTGTYILQINPRTKKPYVLGDKVNANDLIVRIDDRSYENSISIESKRMNLEIAEQELEKQKNLYDKGGVTLYDVRNAEVKIISSRLDYENAIINLEKMNVRAPFNGVIVNLPHYTQGAQIPSGSSIVSIMNYSTMLLDINLPESAINDIKVGQEALITHYTIPQDTIIGEITELSPAISAETRTFKGKLLVDNEDLLIRPGMFVKADIVVDHKDLAIIIPKSIIQNNRNRKYVYVVKQGIATLREIQVGLEDKDNVEVTRGLNRDDQLVIRGYETLRDNSKVKIQK